MLRSILFLMCLLLWSATFSKAFLTIKSEISGLRTMWNNSDELWNFAASRKVKWNKINPLTPAGISHAVRRILRPKGISQILKGFISLKKASRRMLFSWWSLQDLNLWPPARQADALPAALNDRIRFSAKCIIYYTTVFCQHKIYQTQNILFFIW